MASTPDSDGDYFVSRGRSTEPRDNMEYKGAFFQVGFKTSRRIEITGLQFLGPSETSSYIVDLKIQRMVEDWSGIPKFARCIWPWGPYYKIDDLSSDIRVGMYHLEEGVPFKVKLPRPVEVEADTWTDIRFQLHGPTTRRLSYRVENDSVFSDEHGHVMFEFLHSSRQLSGIFFKFV